MATKTTTKTTSKATVKTATTVKAPTPGTVAYVGGQLQTIASDGTIGAAPTSVTNPTSTTPTPTSNTPTPASIKADSDALVSNVGADSLVIANNTGEASTAENNAKAETNNTWTPITDLSTLPAAPTSDNNGLNTNSGTAPNPDYVAAITSLLNGWGITGMSSAVVASVQKGYTPDTVNLIMADPTSKDPLALAYQARFPADQILFKAGKPTLTPAQYLNQEQSYASVLQSYGLSKYATSDTYTKLITNNISPSEAQGRIALGINNIENGDQGTKDAIKQFYPSLNMNDILGAVIDPTQGLSDLQNKVTNAQIGGAALDQGLNTSTTADSSTMGTNALAALGVNQGQAQAGYGNLATYLPTAQKLSDIYTNQTNAYGQVQGEQDIFQNLASAQQTRQSLNNLEVGTFSGRSGTLGPSLGTPRSSFNDLAPGQF